MKRILLITVAAASAAAAVICLGSHFRLPASRESILVVSGNKKTVHQEQQLSVTPNPSAINVNTATQQELESIPGIGPSIAQKIIEEREKNGPYHYLEDLAVVNGIGEKTLDKIKGYLIF